MYVYRYESEGAANVRNVAKLRTPAERSHKVQKWAAKAVRSSYQKVCGVDPSLLEQYWAGSNVFSW